MGKQDERSKKKELPKEAKTRIVAMKNKVMQEFDRTCKTMKDRRVAVRQDIESRIEQSRQNLRRVRTELMPKMNRSVEDIKYNLNRLTELNRKLDSSKKQLEEMTRAINTANLKKLMEKEKKAFEKDVSN